MNTQDLLPDDLPNEVRTTIINLHDIMQHMDRLGYVLKVNVEFFRPEQRCMVNQACMSHHLETRTWSYWIKPEKPKSLPLQPLQSVYTTGQTCSHCGSPKVRPSGACLICDNCGQTTGCG